MRIKTKPYGEITVSEKQRIYFPEGIIGFEGIRYYYIIDSNEGPFYWLQAKGYPELAFLLIDPRLFMKNYNLCVRELDLKSLNYEKREDLIDFAIVTIPENPSMISANLLGPIVINKRTRVAKQVISENDNYSVKQYILDELKKEDKKLVGID